jgi:hypothetical protein
MTMRRVQLTEYLGSAHYTTRPLPNDEFTYVELKLLQTDEEEVEVKGKLIESKYFCFTVAINQISNICQIQKEIIFSYVILNRIHLILRNRCKFCAE